MRFDRLPRSLQVLVEAPDLRSRLRVGWRTAVWTCGVLLAVTLPGLYSAGLFDESRVLFNAACLVIPTLYLRMFFVELPHLLQSRKVRVLEDGLLIAGNLIPWGDVEGIVLDPESGAVEARLYRSGSTGREIRFNLRPQDGYDTIESLVHAIRDKVKRAQPSKDASSEANASRSG